MLAPVHCTGRGVCTVALLGKGPVMLAASALMHKNTCEHSLRACAHAHTQTARTCACTWVRACTSACKCVLAKQRVHDAQGPVPMLGLWMRWQVYEVRGCSAAETGQPSSTGACR